MMLYLMKRFFIPLITALLALGNGYAQSCSDNIGPSPASGSIAGYDYVDLGLPSGLKWATCNVGADSPEGYGNYFAWGETDTQNIYDADNCPTYEKDDVWLRSNGYIDGRGNLTPEHDAARANWGATWRMPTAAEIQELVENTTTTWTTHNGYSGRLVTSKLNGNSIFLPAAGYLYRTSLVGVGDFGYFWGSTPYEYATNCAYYIYFNTGDLGRFWNFRDGGRSVRPVSE